MIDIDIRKYFDSIPHSHLRTFLDQRVTDGVIRRMIDKWLKAGAVEDGLLRRTTEGSPQGGVISPCLSNVFLHYVLDEWFETEVRPRLKGESTLARFADDAIMAFDNIVDAKRVLAVLGKRLARFGLTLHPDKTRLVDFRPQMTEGARHPETDGTSFDFLGLTPTAIGCAVTLTLRGGAALLMESGRRAARSGRSSFMCSKLSAGEDRRDCSAQRRTRTPPR